MTYSITPSYQEQMGFGNTAEGEFGGTPIVTAPGVVADDDTQDEDDSPQGLVTKVKDFLNTVFSRDAAAKVMKKPVVTPKSILAQYNLESNPMGGYTTIEYPSSFYEDLIEKEKAKSIFDQDLNYLSSLYTNRNNARFDERLDKNLNPVVPEIPIPFEDVIVQEDSAPKLDFRDSGNTEFILKPRRRPLGLMSRDNLEGLY